MLETKKLFHCIAELLKIQDRNGGYLNFFDKITSHRSEHRELEQSQMLKSEKLFHCIAELLKIEE